MDSKKFHLKKNDENDKTDNTNNNKTEKDNHNNKNEQKIISPKNLSDYKNNENIIKINNNKETKEKNENIINENTEISNKTKEECKHNIPDNKNYNIINGNEKNETKEEDKKTEEGLKKVKKREMSIKDWGCRNVEVYDIINNPVGEGTFGTVFKAYYKGPKDYAEKIGIPDIVALKKIKTEDEKQGFPITALREIMIMTRLNHKNILQLLEVVTSKPSEKNNYEQNAYLVFEYMEHDLCSLILNNFSYDKSQIKLIIYQLLQGLQYLHKNNVLHRDIKPQNILINNKGELKIADFGLSRIFYEFTKIKRYTNRVVTRYYRCPELLLGETEYGPAVDIWSVGCVFWEIITGDILFTGDNDNDVFTQICKKCGTPNETNWPGVSKLPLFNKIIPQKQYECELDKKYKNYNKFDDITFDLLMKMICLDPKKRIKIDEAFKHPYFTSHLPKMCEEKDMPKIEEEFHYYSQCKKEQPQKQQNIANGEYNKGNKNFIGKKRHK